MLDEESQRVVGYVDTLRESIMVDSQSRKKEREAREVWVNDVREALGSSRVTVWEEVRDRMEAVHRSEALVAGASPGIDSRDVEVGEIKVNIEMMERKGRKADHGFALAAEIKGLLVDTRRVSV